MLIATYVAFGVAVLAGCYLIATAGWELLLVGAASILAGVLYTGGPRPYGYEGLGEVFVFLFFGVVAVAGSYFAQIEAAGVGGARARRPGRAAGAARSSSSTTCATWRPTGARGSARSPSGSGASGRAALYVAMLGRAFLTAPLPWVLGSLSPWLLPAVAGDPAGACRSSARCAPAPTARR